MIKSNKNIILILFLLSNQPNIQRGFNDESHDFCGKTLAKLININKGPAVKLGQNLALHHHVLPESFIKHMEQFCQENSATSFKEVQKLFKKDTGKDIFDVFEYFEEDPIAVGSIAQVHRAKFHEGDYVAVKIQHPNIIYQTKGDVNIVKQSCALAEYFFEGTKLNWIHKEFEKNMNQEISFKNEVRNIKKAKMLFRKDRNIVIPKVYESFSSERVLVMSFEEGKSICDVRYRKANNIKVEEISKLLNNVFYKQIFEFGFVHADPHHGNLFIRKEGHRLKLVLLDFGLFIELDDKFMRDYANLWRGVLTQNSKAIEKACVELGVINSKVFISMITGKSYSEVMNKNDFNDTQKRLLIRKGKKIIIFIIIKIIITLILNSESR